MASTVDAKREAGGGTNEGHERRIPAFSSVIKNHVGAIFEELLREHRDAKRVFTEVQKSVEPEFSEFLGADGKGDVNSFLAYLASSQATILGPEQPEDLSHPLSHYFISSSHNTYLTGNQLSSEASTEGYTNVLLRGCRCVEIDVWDGKPPEDQSSSSENEAPSQENKGFRNRMRNRMGFGKNKVTKDENVAVKQDKPESYSLPEPWSATKKAEPRVLHGYTLTKEVSFREVCEAIRDAAFVTSDLPIIVSLEVHTSLEQQEIMVDIMNRVWRDYLVPQIDTQESKVAPLPTPKDLRRKILVKVKYTPPEEAKEEQAAEEKGLDRPPSASSSSDVDLPPGTAKEAKPKKKKMLESLSRLGVYTRAHHFKSFDQPEAKEPTHVFSLSEGAVAEALESQKTVLFRHNKHFMMRCYPKGTRISSSNLTPTIFWRQGIQIVALNWQKWDKGTMLNEAMFANTGGWVLKPATYRSDETPRAKRIGSASSASLHPDTAHEISNNAAAAEDSTRAHAHSSKKLLDLTIEFIAGQSLPLPPGDESEVSFRPYVKVSLHAETLTSPQQQPQGSTLRRSLSRSRSLRRTGSRKHREHTTADQSSANAPANDTNGGNSNNANSVAPSHTAMGQRTTTTRTRNPDFARQRLAWEGIPIDEESLCFVRFKVEDDVQFARDPMAGWACVRLDRMRDGVRTVRLFDADGKMSDGLLLVRVTKVLRDMPGPAAAAGNGSIGETADLPLR